MLSCLNYTSSLLTGLSDSSLILRHPSFSQLLGQLVENTNVTMSFNSFGKRLKLFTQTLKPSMILPYLSLQTHFLALLLCISNCYSNRGTIRWWLK